MNEREQELINWCRQYYSIVDDSFVRVSGDASFRKYYRFSSKHQSSQKAISLIAVDAPPKHENNDAFIHLSKLLAEHAMPVPLIKHLSTQQGFFILTDFGDQLLLDQLTTDNADYLYGLASDTLCQLQTIPTDSLPLYDSTLLQQEMALFSTWYLQRHKHINIDQELQHLLEQTFTLLEQNALQQPQVFVHRDYHSRNLMLLDKDRLGVIDFQDAVLGPVSYDLVSLLRDCYIDWPAQKIQQWIRHFINQQGSYYDYAEFKRWFDLMGVQRHLKAVGIFCRLNYRDGKANYLNDIPRTLNYLLTVSSEYQELQEFNNFLKTAP